MKPLVVVLGVLAFISLRDAGAVCNSSRAQAVQWAQNGGYCEIECRSLRITGGWCRDAQEAQIAILGGNLIVRHDSGGGYPPLLRGSYTLGNGQVVTIYSLAAEDNNNWGGGFIETGGVSRWGRETIASYPCRIRGR